MMYAGAGGGGGGGGGGMGGSLGNTTQYVPESKVLHIRGLPPGATAEEMVAYMSQFGTVAYVLMLPNRGQGLCEFDVKDSAVAVMTYAASARIELSGKQVYVNYSRSQQINRSGATKVGPGGVLAPPMGGHMMMGGGGGGMGGPVTHNGERIILMTINNPVFPITVDVLTKILSPHGKLLRLVIFTKKGVQALAEFEKPEDAARAQGALDGKEIYDRCCQLKIVFSRNDRLNVRVNNERSHDFTDNTLPTHPHPQGPAGGPAYAMGGWGATGGWGAAAAGGWGGGAAAAMGGYGGYGAAPQAGAYGAPQAGAYGGGGGGAPGFGGYVAPPGYGAPPGAAGGAGGGAGAAPSTAATTPVVIVYNVPDKVGITQLFNLFGLYGNVQRIKLMKDKGAALVQMEDHVQAQGSLENLNESEVFDKKLQVNYSKHDHIAPGRAPEKLPDGSEAPKDYEDFSTSSLNRFKKPEHFKHIYKPSAVVHFANGPPSLTEESLKELFKSKDASEPSAVKFFPPRAGTDAATERKLGLLEWGTVKEAVEAVAVANNQEIEGHTLRLAFSENKL